MTGRPPVAATIRWWRHITIDPSGCWLFTPVQRDGYARLTLQSHVSWPMAHRFGYELLVGPIPKGMQLDHLCRVRNCVNPNHLEVVTPKENIRRGNTGKGQRDGNGRFTR